MEPLLASAVSVLILLASRLAAIGADPATLAASDGAPNNWSWVEKVGTVGVCVWMLVWFQRRNDRDKEELSKITVQAVTALERNAESDRDLRHAIERLTEAMDNRPNIVRG